jgi:hypothetical protein
VHAFEQLAVDTRRFATLVSEPVETIEMALDRGDPSRAFRVRPRLVRK